MKKTNEAYVKKLHLDVFAADIHIVVTETPDVYIDKSKLRDWCSPGEPHENLSQNCGGFCFNKEQSDYYIVIPPTATLNIAVHETVHCIDRLFDNRGQDADYSNDEVYAYYVGWLSQIVVDWLNEVYYELTK